MKVCSKCKQERDESEFFKHPGTKDGLQSVCKICKRLTDNEYTKRNKQKRADTSKKWKEANPNKTVEYRNNRREFLESLKQPCVKCGETRLYLIQFHHVNPATKEFNIARMVDVGGRTKDTIMEEVKKCVCLCSNCHDEFHWFYGKNPTQPVEALQEYLGKPCKI